MRSKFSFTSIHVIFIARLYRPPGQEQTTDNKFFEQIVEICCQSETTIVGDLNLPIHTWGDPPNSRRALTRGRAVFLHQLVKQLTTREGIVDPVLTVNESIITNVQV